MTFSPLDRDIPALLRRTVGDPDERVGGVVGLIGPGNRRVISHGVTDKNDPRPLSGDTFFEIGSLTKVFTALLLADMALRGEVALLDPVGSYLPPDVRVPERAGEQMRLQHLATHTSGLPRLPTNLKPANPENPYGGYTTAHLYDFLSTYELPRDIDSRFEYSNLGFGLLGHLLERCAGTDYDSLIQARIAVALSMNSTAISLSPNVKCRPAKGHNEKFEPVADWDMPTLAGAGALRSTANDLLNFLAATLGYVSSPLQPAMAAMLAIRRECEYGAASFQTALGWQIFPRDGYEVICHEGGTTGYSSFFGYTPDNGVGVVVLINVCGVIGHAGEIGFILLDTLRSRALPSSGFLSR